VRTVCGGGREKPFSNYQAAKRRRGKKRWCVRCGAENCRAVQSDLSTHEAAQQLVATATSAFGASTSGSANTASGRLTMRTIERMSMNNGIAPSPVNLDRAFVRVVKHSVDR